MTHFGPLSQQRIQQVISHTVNTRNVAHLSIMDMHRKTISRAYHTQYTEVRIIFPGLTMRVSLPLFGTAHKVHVYVYTVSV